MAKCSAHIVDTAAVVDNRFGEDKIAAEAVVVAEVGLEFADIAAEVAVPAAVAVNAAVAVQSSLEEHLWNQL